MTWGRVGRIGTVAVAVVVAGCTAGPASTVPTQDSQGPTTRPASSPGATPTRAASTVVPSPTLELPPVTDLAAAGAKAFQRLPGPDFIFLADGFAYANGAGDGIAKFDHDAKQVATWMPLGDACGGLDAGFGAVWAATCGGPGLVRLDTKTDTMTPIPVGGVMPESEASVGAGEGAVWIVIDSSPRTLVKVDPKTNKVAETYELPGNPAAVRAGAGGVWIADPGASIIRRFDPVSEKLVAEVAVGERPQFLTVGEGAVWTMDQLDGTVSRIDPATNKVVATIRLGEQVEGGDIAVGGGFVWLRGSLTLLFKIDPATNTIVARYGPSSGSGGVAAGDDGIWITAHDIQTIWRLPLS